MNTRKPYRFREIRKANKDAATVEEATPAEHLHCPHCFCRMSQVLQSRPVEVEGTFYRVRQRRCRNCGKVFHSKEVTDENASLPVNRRSKRNNPDVGNIFGS